MRLHDDGEEEVQRFYRRPWFLTLAAIAVTFFLVAQLALFIVSLHTLDDLGTVQKQNQEILHEVLALANERTDVLKAVVANQCAVAEKLGILSQVKGC